MQIKQRIVTVVFLCCLILPSVAFYFLHPYVDTTNYEKRELAARPVLSVENWEQFPKLFEDYINDNAAFKNQFVKLNKAIDLKIFKTVDSPIVLLGKQGWMFYKSDTDGDPIADYKGINAYSPEQMQTILENLEYVRDHFREQGKEFVVFIAPNKEQIYSDYIPDSIPVVQPERRVDKLVDYLHSNTDVPVIYPKDELLAGREIADTYYKYDTHWNSFGGFIGEQQMMEVLKGERVELKDMQVQDDPLREPRGLSDALNLSDFCADSTNPKVVGYREDVEILSSYRSENEYFIQTESTAPDPRSIFVIRDSFSEAFYDLLPKEFAKTTFSHRNAFDPEQIREQDPDIIVYEVVERYADCLLDNVLVSTQ